MYLERGKTVARLPRYFTRQRSPTATICFSTTTRTSHQTAKLDRDLGFQIPDPCPLTWMNDLIRGSEREIQEVRDRATGDVEHRPYPLGHVVPAIHGPRGHEQLFLRPDDQRRMTAASPAKHRSEGSGVRGSSGHPHTAKPVQRRGSHAK